jgi:glycosyltransferase involved in cell wall biosynthesis
MPVYNGEQFLRQAIESVLSQTYLAWELIVVDDGSTDGTRDILAAFGPRIRTVHQEHRGLSTARNVAIQMARGEYIAFLDSDDMWDPEFLQTLVPFAFQHPQAALVYCGSRLMDAEDRDLPQSSAARLVPNDMVYNTLLRENFLIASTVLARRSAILAAGAFDPMLKSAEDWDLWQRLAKRNIFAGIPKRLAHYRLHSASLSTNVSQMRQSILEMVEKHFGLDDGQPQHWSTNKRLAYGGAFRYGALTSVRGQNDWPACATHLRRALGIDPTLSIDLSLFYELALGTQPAGYRGTAQYLTLEDNAASIHRVLGMVFSPPVDPALEAFRRQTFGTAFYALGLAGYNTHNLGISRMYMRRATHFRPELWFDRRLVGDLLKSYLSRTFLDRLRQLRFAKPRS